MKTYPLDVEDSSNDYYQSAMSKGHHDFDTFKAQCRERLYFADWLLEPEHIWFRKVPIWDGYGYCFNYVEARPNSRGAFPVTWAAQYETQSNYRELPADRKSQQLPDASKGGVE